MGYLEIADEISRATAALESALYRANDAIQSDEAPQPYDQWDSAVMAVTSACADISEAGEFGEHLDTIMGALRGMGR